MKTDPGVSLNTLFIAGIAGLVALCLPAKARDLVSEDFSTGRFQAKESFLLWSGPERAGQYGSVTFTEAPAPVGSKRTALVIINNGDSTEEQVRRPVLRVKTPDFGLKAKSGVMEMKFMVPLEGRYRADFFFGGRWDKGAVILVLEDSNVFINRGRDRLKVGNYKAGEWLDLRLVFDFTDKTYSLFWNGAKWASEVPWGNTELTGIPFAEICADVKPVYHDNEPVLYLDSIRVSEASTQ